MSVPHLNSGESLANNPGRETEAYPKHKDSSNSNVILPTQFDENSELADEAAEKKKETLKSTSQEVQDGPGEASPTRENPLEKAETAM